MKDWFPLTSYDFYAYLTSGMVVLAAADHAFLASELASQADWKVVVAVFWAAIAYLIGHIIAIPSSAIFEHLIAKRVLQDPSAVILGLQRQRWREHCFGAIVGAREYEPFPPDYRAGIVAKLARQLNVAESCLEADSAFQCAFSHARSIPDSAARMDSFLDQYGLCRNVSFASVVATVFLTMFACETGNRTDILLAVGAAVLAIGLFIRFIKFYAAYTREVFRAFDRAC